MLAAYQGRWEQEQDEATPPQVYAIQALGRSPVLRAAVQGLLGAFRRLRRRLPGGRLRPRPAARATQRRRRHRRRRRRHRVRRPPGRAAGRPRPRASQVQDRGGAAAAGDPGRGARLAARHRRALPRRRGHHAHRVLRLSGGAAPSRARLHPAGSVPARLHHQRHGHLAARPRLRHGHRLLRRPTRPARRASSACCTT